jgi:hypothetical protein
VHIWLSLGLCAFNLSTHQEQPSSSRSRTPVLAGPLQTLAVPQLRDPVVL